MITYIGKDCYHTVTGHKSRMVNIMTVSLTPMLESYVKQKVEAGMYNSVSEVVREALRLLEEKDALQAIKREALKRDINLGLDSLNSGEGRPLNINSIKAQGRELLRGCKNS